MRPVLTLASAQLRADLRHARTGKTGGRLSTTVVAYGFSGVVLALSLLGAPPAHVLFVGGSFGMVLSAFGVVGSYDELMGRPRDNAWLTTLPATEGAHYGARLLGIGVYVGVMGVGVAVPVGLAAGWAHGATIGALVGLGLAGAIGWTAALSLAVLWGLTLALDARPLRLALGVARTVLIGGLVLGFQFVGASPDALGAPWWPGTWLAEAAGGRPTAGLAVLAGSLLGLGLLFGAVFPGRYFRLLRRLADGARREGARTRIGRQMTGLERALVARGPVRAAYGFATAAFADDRLIRGRLWPSALLPAGFVVFGWLSGGLGSTVGAGARGTLAGTMRTLQDPDLQLHLSVLVVLLFCVQTLVQTLQTSDHAEASWVFGTLPDARPRIVQLGAQAALVWRVLLPLHVGIAVLLTLAMPAADAVAHAAFWFAASALGSRVAALCYGAPPFSRRSDRFNAAARFVPLIVSIPLGIGLMIGQVAALASFGRAAAAVAGLLATSALLGAAVVRWPGRRSRRRRPAPRPDVRAVAAPLTPEAERVGA